MARAQPSDVAFGIWRVQDQNQQNAIARLPAHERDKVFADLSGNPDWWGAAAGGGGGVSHRHRMYTANDDLPTTPMNEEPSFIDNCLKEMDHEIFKLLTRYKNNEAVLSSAFGQALQSDPHYVNDRHFKLMFLRADEFDVKKSAQRLIDHFECKMDFFGPELLSQDISYNHLSPEEQDIVKSGRFQFLEDTDHAGRRVWFHRVAKSDFQNPNVEVRVSCGDLYSIYFVSK